MSVKIDDAISIGLKVIEKNVLLYRDCRELTLASCCDISHVAIMKILFSCKFCIRSSISRTKLKLHWIFRNFGTFSPELSPAIDHDLRIGKSIPGIGKNWANIIYKYKILVGNNVIWFAIWNNIILQKRYNCKVSSIKILIGIDIHTNGGRHPRHKAAYNLQELLTQRQKSRSPRKNTRFLSASIYMGLFYTLRFCPKHITVAVC